MTIQILSPAGRVGAHRIERAKLQRVLAGRRVLVLDNGKPGARLLLSRAAEEIAKRTGAHFVGARRKRTAATPCEDTLFEEILQSTEVVLTGTAD